MVGDGFRGRTGRGITGAKVGLEIGRKEGGGGGDMGHDIEVALLQGLLTLVPAEHVFPTDELLLL